ncbi:ArsR family transcriptional regulator [Herbihabitans rhizosphaerae]|uniref:ArsR family transcriptional regulator n=1 Tax=Herbihabitans rhizosphaerae TaxID=1872711 RepID=A0A4Q7KDF3_9PSEU|nr:winged helix-turn-helix domain-containing protein [Herbihabitans rhizosphaerae]RZS31254.1 ArsR family transcriptional regulator [Herbihabitans rhizosphaerae]
MLRIHFTEADYARTYVSDAPDPLWETVLGLQKLCTPARVAPVYAEWKRHARPKIGTAVPKAAVGMVHTLAPPLAYFPDFLTPPEAVDGLDAGLDALRRTPRHRLRGEVAQRARIRPLPRWSGALAAGEQEALDELTEAVRLVHDALIAPEWSGVEAHVDADHSARKRAQRAWGVHGMLSSLEPSLHWNPPVLSGRYPVEKDVYLNGRGLRLVPTYFCWGNPVALADSDLPPVVVYPAALRNERAEKPVRGDALADLLGRTRAKALIALSSASSTSELAERLGVSAATASEHATVLRRAGLIASNRDGSSVVHALTPLGDAMLFGDAH